MNEITTLFDIPDSLSTMIGYVQPCFEYLTGRFSHNTHQLMFIFRLYTVQGITILVRLLIGFLNNQKG